MSVANCPSPLARRRKYLRSPIARKVGGPLKAMSFLMSTQAGFSPDDIASLAHWYDATAVTGVNDGDPVGTWPDEEGTDDLTQATSNQRPTLQTNVIGGNQIVRFDGGNDNMTAAFSALSQPNHIFLVVEQRSISTSDVEFYFDSTDNSNRHLIRQDNNADGATISAGTNQSGTGFVDTNPHIYSFLVDGVNGDLRQDGTSVISGDVGSDSFDGLTVGANLTPSAYGPIDVGELLIYSSGLSTSDRNSVESYLSSKWGIAI